MIHLKTAHGLILVPGNNSRFNILKIEIFQEIQYNILMRIFVDKKRNKHILMNDIAVAPRWGAPRWRIGEYATEV